MLLLAIAGEELFLVVFGVAWGEAGIYAQILSFWAIFWFISSPLSTILSVREKLTVGFGTTILNFSTRFLSLMIGGVLGSAILSIVLFSISGVLAYGFSCFVFLRLAGVSLIGALRLIAKTLTFAVPFLIPLILAKIFAVSAILVTLLASLVLIAYGLYVFLMDPLLCNLVNGLKTKFR